LNNFISNTYISDLLAYIMINQNITSPDHENTPKEVIANTARFNKQFLNRQLGGNPVSVSIGKMLTVMGDQDNTIRTLSRILGREHNDQHLHDMHNELFGGLIDDSGRGREGMDLSNISSKLTTYIYHQNQQIQTLIDEIKKNFDEINSQIKSSSSS
jgi:hypothetical protein